MATRARIDLLRTLETFVAVADSGSMTVAARQLKITQSAISQQLKQLETEMRVPLMDRNSRPLRLTPAGQALRNHAADILLHADQARAEIRQIAAGPLPHLRIAMFGTLAGTLAPAIIDAVVRRALPITTVTILRGMAVQHARDLPRREADIAITSNPLIDVEGLERHELIQERFVLILPRGTVPKQASLREIASRLPMIRYSPRTEAGRMIEQHLRRQRIDLPPHHAFDAPEDMFAMIAMGQGFAITMPTHIVHALGADMPVELRALPKPALGRSIVLVGRRGELGPLPQHLAQLCRRTLRKEYLPRVEALMPTLADHLTIVEESAQSASNAE